MQYVEVRRHSLRIRPHEHLSQEGVLLARRVGESIGPFSRVISSPSPRAYETAIAMGFAVDEFYEPVPFTDQEYQALDGLTPESATFTERSRRMRDDALAQRFAEALRSQWERVAAAVPEDSMALVITHGGYIDSSAVACLPTADHEMWGPLFGHCEGIRLCFDGGSFQSGKLLRV
jgi:broad specificity phosphatase PhoE